MKHIGHVSGAFKISISLVLGGVLVGCGSSNTATPNSGDPRVVWENISLPILNLSGTGNSTNGLLTLAASIIPPVVLNTSIDADDIFFNGTDTYVSYNIPGNTHMGGIDWIDMLIPAFPVRLASTTFSNTTVNGVYVTGNTVYAVGATTGTTTSGWPAILMQMSLGGSLLNYFFSTPTKTFDLQTTYAGTAITSWKNSLYALSGSTGGLTIINPTTLTQTAYTAIPDARALSFSSTSNLWVVAGGGHIYEINAAGAILNTVAIAGNNIAQSKSTIQVGKTMIAVSLGDQGAAIVCQSDRHVLASIAAPVVSGLDSTLTVTNAVTASNGLLFAANGEAGVFVYTMTTSAPTTSACNTVTLTQLGSIQLGSLSYSANNVRFYNGSLYVATGSGGFKVITTNLLAPILSVSNPLLDFN